MIDPQGSQFRFRRAIAALMVLIGVLFAPIERLLPDAHDADAPATTRSLRSADNPAPTASPVRSADADPARSDHEGAPSQAPIHATHVDHCAHGHVLTVDVSVRRPAPRDPSPEPYDLASQWPASISLAPHRRPPIA